MVFQVNPRPRLLWGNWGSLLAVACWKIKYLACSLARSLAGWLACLQQAITAFLGQGLGCDARMSECGRCSACDRSGAGAGRGKREPQRRKGTRKETPREMRQVHHSRNHSRGWTYRGAWAVNQAKPETATRAADRARLDGLRA